MKKLNFFLAAAAATMLAGCVDDTTVVSQGETAGTTSAIGFGFSVPNQLRATTLVGESAAQKLNNEFVVYGTKHLSAEEDGTATNDQPVFQNYVVKYTSNSAGTSESNTNNWEYDGLTPYGETKVKPAVTSQSVKYWDYSATKGYTFTAFSAGWNNLKNDYVSVEKITTGTGQTPTKYDKGYKVTVKEKANLDSVFYSDRVEVAKANYGKPVTLTFRSFGSRVRVGFYSTVPGYDVKINSFYYDKDASEAVTTFKAMADTETDGNFRAALWNVNSAAQNGNTLTVTYGDDKSGTENQPTVANGTATYMATLTLGGNIKDKTLGTSATGATWDKENGAYTTVFPNEACANPMLIRCSYTLTSKDGSKETITVNNARVVIPAAYVQWKPNYSYTYLFKISNKTNGTTGSDPKDPDNPGTGDDPEGLFPITFDASVVDASTGNQELIGTMSTNTILTYANGSDVTKNGEYKAGEEIYVVNQKTTPETGGSHAVIEPTEIGDDANKAQVYKLTKSDATTFTEGDIYAQLNGTKLGITMTALSGDGTAASKETSVPLADGTSLSLSAVKFKPSDAGTYAYVYTTTKYEAPTYSEVGSASYIEGTVYYFKTSVPNEVYYTASGINADNFEANKTSLYTQTKEGTTGVYDIKVITVKAN